MRFEEAFFGYGLLTFWGFEISQSSIIPCCCLFSFKTKATKRMLVWKGCCFVDKTPKKWGQFWNNRTKHFVITPSKYTEYILVPASHCIRSSHKLQFHLLFAPLAFVWSFLQMEARPHYGFSRFINRPHQPCYPCQATLTVWLQKNVLAHHLTDQVNYLTLLQDLFKLGALKQAPCFDSQQGEGRGPRTP